MSWPKNELIAPVNISSFSMLESVGMHFCKSFTIGRVATAGWPVAKLVEYVPFIVHSPINVARMWYRCTSVGSGANVDIGIYTKDFYKIVSSGAVAASTG